MEQSENSYRFQDLSHRAARRVIQRAFVLAGRSRSLRDHIRTVEVETLWKIEDWGFAWTVLIDRGRLEFSRRPSKRPDAILLWPFLEDFIPQLEGKPLLRNREADFIQAGDLKARNAAMSLYTAFIPLLRQVLSDPFDEDGTPLIGQML
ncbi:MAG TPA: hypothetical protein VMX16_05990 [Terriglobia bacterium]|nr:hypothetical protein [Terriglobia bacterium]